ncbi:MAG TPA: hemerythrin domain-containing protein [Rhizomicrobium sp.]
MTLPGLAAVPLAACSREVVADVGAVEDLMREHGILRRAMIVFRECAARLADRQFVDANALHHAAQLIRDFGQNYHEKLEEENIFPELSKARGEAGAMVQVLIDQHKRGREIIDYLLSTTRGTVLRGLDLVAPLHGFEVMYANHAAREDTIIFPAWKKTIGAHAVDEMGEKFEDIEKKQFGGDGFAMALKQIGEIERALGLTDLAQFTAPPLRRV